MSKSGYEIAPYTEENKLLGLCGLLATYTKGNNERDLMLVGKYGYIWEYSATQYYVVVTSPAVATKHLQLEEKLKKGEEVGFVVEAKDALEWVKLIKVPNRRASQLKLLEERLGV